jgi:hypothetical protein
MRIHLRHGLRAACKYQHTASYQCAAVERSAAIHGVGAAPHRRVGHLLIRDEPLGLGVTQRVEPVLVLQAPRVHLPGPARPSARAKEEPRFYYLTAWFSEHPVCTCPARRARQLASSITSGASACSHGAIRLPDLTCTRWPRWQTARHRQSRAWLQLHSARASAPLQSAEQVAASEAGPRLALARRARPNAYPGRPYTLCRVWRARGPPSPGARCPPARRSARRPPRPPRPSPAAHPGRSRASAAAAGCAAAPRSARSSRRPSSAHACTCARPRPPVILRTVSTFGFPALSAAQCRIPKPGVRFRL